MNNRLGVACLCGMIGSGAAVADELSGEILVGWRDVSVDGSLEKYRQHINLEDGGRLLGLRVDYRRDGAENRLPDQVEIDVRNLGGDPFENIHLGIRKYGQYNFRYDRRKSQYFYNDLLIDPADASIEASNGGDFHRFDVDRIQETIELDAHFSSQATGTLRFDRYTREGSSTTTRDIQRDEFELHQPIDETSQAVTLGFRYRWESFNLAAEQRFREFDSRSEVFLPGFSIGENPDDSATLDFYYFDQPYGYDSSESRIRLGGQPNGRFDWRISAAVIDLELDIEAEELAQGIDFQGNPFFVDEAGTGSVDRDMTLLEFEGSYAMNDRLSAIAAVRQKKLDQEGAMDFGMDGGRSDWDVETTGAQLGIQWSRDHALTIAAGWIGERRDTDVVSETETDTSATSNETDRNGFFASLNYQPGDQFRMTARVDSNRFDDPFTLASPTDSLRMRIRGRYSFDSGVIITAAYIVQDYENDNSGFTARTDQADIRVAYKAERWNVSGGVSTIDRDREYEQLVTGGTRQDLFAVNYRGDTTFLDGRLVYRTSDAMEVGGHFSYYDNDGSFATDRRDLGIYAEYAFSEEYLARLTYRNVDYEEDLEDYDADIIEIAFGLNW